MKVLVVDNQRLTRMNILKQIDDSFIFVESPSYKYALKKIENYIFGIRSICLKVDGSSERLGLKLMPGSVKYGFYSIVITSIEFEEVAKMAYLGANYNKTCHSSNDRNDTFSMMLMNSTPMEHEHELQ